MISSNRWIPTTNQAFSPSGTNTSKKNKISRCSCSKETYDTMQVQTPKCISMSQQPSERKTLSSNLTTRCQIFNALLNFCKKLVIKLLNQTTQHLQKTQLAQKEATVSSIKVKRLREHQISHSPKSHNLRQAKHQKTICARLTLKSKQRKTRKERNSQAKKPVV